MEMTCSLVHTSYSLPEWQAVKLTFFAPCLKPVETSNVGINARTVFKGQETTCTVLDVACL